MKIFSKLFHFFGGVHFAILLIALSAILVAAGTFIESKTGSHLFAAQYIYGNFAFLFLLSLFFINILFSALRRWPFKKRHIPFLITHLGLLMIIGGTILKNQFGLQGILSVWEGNGNQHVLIPHTYALHLESKEENPYQDHSIEFQSFRPQVYYPFQFPHLKCKLVSYAPHVKEKLETWIKNSNLHIAGLPRIPVHEWSPQDPFPQEVLCNSPTSQTYSLLALRTSHLQEALQKAYAEGLSIHVKTKDERQFHQMPFQEIFKRPYVYEKGTLSAFLQIPISSEKEESPCITLDWLPVQKKQKQKLRILLQGQESLSVQNLASKWFNSSLIIDLKRPYPKLCFIQDENENIFLYAFDQYGRIYSEEFQPNHLQRLIAYDEGFGGYSVQSVVPFPNFPVGREDKEKAAAYELVLQLQEAISNAPSLTPPLLFFKRGCEKAGIDVATTFVQFLLDWNANPGLIFHPVHPLSDTLQLLFKHLDWEEISGKDKQTLNWIIHLLDKLEGTHPSKELKKNRWPFLSEFKNNPSLSYPNLFSQQIASIIDYLPLLDSPTLPLSPENHACFLSAYFRMYGIDFTAFFPFQDRSSEQFDHLERYWKAHSDNSQDFKHNITIETPLTHFLIPETVPSKLEDQRPGMLLELQEGSSKQILALAYDASASGMQWPALNGKYKIRFQPKLEKLPYRLRLREARQIFYPESSQVYSYESDLWITEEGQVPIAETLSMNHVYETWDGFRFYLSGVGISPELGIKSIQLAVNYDPAKSYFTYPGAILVFIGVILLFWKKKDAST